MEVRDLIRQISDPEPMNPYQLAGMAAVIEGAGITIERGSELHVEGLGHVLMLLDRAGAESSPYLVDLRQAGSRITLFPRFTRESLEQLVYVTSFEGRRQAVRDNLVPVVYEIPNWLDLVRSLTRYCLDRDDDSMSAHVSELMDVILSFLFAAARQPFDSEARSESEYALSRVVESILKSAGHDSLGLYLPYIEKVLDFLTSEMFPSSLNTFERRIVEVFGIRSALKKRSPPVQADLAPSLDSMVAQALVTALGQIPACPDELLRKLEDAVSDEAPQQRERFRKEILDRINHHSESEIETRVRIFRRILEREAQADEQQIRDSINFIRSFGEEWKDILSAYEEMIDGLPERVQDAFAEILASRILSVDKPDVKQALIHGLCRIVVKLEETRKQASRDLVHTFVGLFLDRAYSSEDLGEKISSLNAVEALGVTLGTNDYFLMARELLNQLLGRNLIEPREKKYTIEDDDTGEPLVLAEEVETNQPHVQHLKSLMAIVASNPRIMSRLVPYLTVQIEMGTVRLCDEDLIQYSISCLLRSNSSVTHFPIRTLIKAIPYSFKDIGPLDTLRLTAAGLAKELADRGVKPIGNFLGKLRGDIHWRGSIENFFFCQGIIKYLASGDPETMSEWMPPESMPYLNMENWCSESEARAIKGLCKRIFDDLGMDLSDSDGMNALISADTARYRHDPDRPEFAGKVVLESIDLLKGLHNKYFIVRRTASGKTVNKDLDRLERIVAERLEIKQRYLTPDSKDPVPAPIALTEGTADHLQEIARINRDQPGTPIVLRARKAGHAYAQKATYIEECFEAFNKDLSLESLQETLATTVNNTHFETITEESFPHSLRFLDGLIMGAAANGHSSYYLEQAGSDLRNAGALGLTFDKIRDLVRIIQKELDDIHDLYRNWFEQPFDRRLTAHPMDKLPRKLKDLTTLKQIPETDFFRNYLKTLYISDLQARDGNLRVLEIFVEKVELFLNRRLADSGRVPATAHEPGPEPVWFHFPDQGEVSPCKIGMKASLLRFAENTPPYFVITTDHLLREPEETLNDSAFRQGLADAVKRLEELWGRGFGDPSNPALLSVRSGGRISMPGMMTTLTNVGINDEIAECLAAKVGTWFAYDCYRRFLQEFSQSVFGVAREEFQDIIDENKFEWGVNRKAEMTGEQMRQLAFDYKRRVAQLAPRAVEILDQGKFLDILIHSAVVVLQSCDGSAARKYRQAAGIDGNWRTPVTVQAMVYGNMEMESSGTGVVAYNPFSMDLRGEFSLGDQGTDVVDGKVVTIPVYDLWKRRESMAFKMPAQWKDLSSILFRIAERLHMDVSVEYTVEKGKVFVLQIRKQRERKERIPALKTVGYNVIAQGTGVSGKIFRGIMVTDRDQIAPFRHIAKAHSIIDAMNKNLAENEKLDGFIFVVNDPIPEEVMEEVFSLPVATALVSRLGGRGAHVADIAKALGKVYVGQVRGIAKFSGKPPSVRFHVRETVVGSKMIIHGQTGEIALYDEVAENDIDQGPNNGT